MAKTIYQVGRENNTIPQYYELMVEKDPVDDLDVVRKKDLAGVVVDISSFVGSGLTWDATNEKIVWNGNLTADAVINTGGSNKSIIFNTNTGSANFSLFPTPGIISMIGHITGSASLSTLVLQPSALQFGLKRYSDSAMMGFVWTYTGSAGTPRLAVHDEVYNVGLRYAGNYASNNTGVNYNPRWLLDQEAAINLATGIAQTYGITSFTVYNPANSYTARQAVFVENSSYVCILNAAAGITPKNNPTYWVPLAIGLYPRGLFVAGTQYYLGEYVMENGSGYVCYVANNDSLAPSANPTKWALFASKGDAGANSTQIQIEAEIADMIAYTGVLDSVAVTDPLRGSIFTYDNTGLTPDNGITFPATGRGVGVWRREYDTSESIPVTWYGAVGDWSGSAGTDDTIAINMTIVAVNQIKAALGESKILFPQTLGLAYRITTPLTAIQAEIDVVAEVPILVDSTNESPSSAYLTIGEAGTVNTNRNFKIAGVTRRTNSTWTNNSNVGARFINLSSCNIDVDLIKSFTVGFELVGNTRQCAYNKVSYGQSLNNKYGAKITAAGAGGFCNQNYFGPTRYGCDTSLNLTSDRFGVWITSDDGVYTQNNGNTFIGSSFELNATGAGVSIPIWIENGIDNAFVQCRSANADQYAVRYGNASGGVAENNHVHFIYFAHTAYTGTPRGYADQPFVNTMNYTVVSNAQQLDWPVVTRRIFQSEYLYNRINDYSASTVALAGHHFVASGSTLARSIQATTTTAVTVNTDESINITTSYGMARFVRSNRCKRFHIMYNANASRGGRFFIRMMDSAGAAITTGLKTNISMSFTTSYGGCFRSGVDGAGNDAIGLSFEVPANCVLFEAGFTGGTNPAQIYNWEILAFDDTGAVMTYCLAKTEDMVGTRLPQAVTNLTHYAPQRVYNLTSGIDVGDAVGWTYSAANGWKAFGVLI